MNDNHNHYSGLNLEEIWDQVPSDYYQRSVETNLLQRMWHTRKLKMVIKVMGGEKNMPKKILDVGCASGWFLSKLWEEYPKASYAGVDVHKKAIDYGKKRYKNLKLICADAHSLPFPNESFDVVICTEVLEHVKNPEKVLREIKRVLTKDGIAIIEMDSGNLLFRAIWYWWVHLRRGVWRDSHIHTFDTAILQNLILESGFLIVRKETFNLKMAVAFVVKKKS